MKPKTPKWLLPSRIKEQEIKIALRRKRNKTARKARRKNRK